jgi:preprotein translocase subunit SecG
MLLDIVVPLVHVVACVFLIVVVLLQRGKGADMGAVFGGGGSQTLFGSTGAGNVLTKLTGAMAVTFMITSLTLALSERERPSSALIERLPQATAPVAPAPDAPAPDAGVTVDTTVLDSPAPLAEAAPADEAAGDAAAADAAQPGVDDAARDDAPADAAPPTPATP